MDTDSKDDAEFDVYSATYDQAVNEAIAFSGLKVDFFTRVKADYFIDIVSSHFGKRDAELDILDVGCGVGNYHPLLIDKVGTVTGTDVSSSSISQAKKRNPSVRYEWYDGQTLPFGNHTFDVVFTICVMHHVPPSQWGSFSSEMRRVTKPGGLAVIFEHNPRNPLTQRIVSNCVFDKNAVLLYPSKVRELLTGAGFTDIRTRHILTIPATTSLLRSVDLTLGLLPFGAQYFVRACV